MKHHFLPKFYMKRWCNGGGELVEYVVRNNRLRSRLSPPAGTGYVPDLYSFQDKDAKDPHLIETGFFQHVDNAAARVLEKLEKGYDLDENDRLQWARFIVAQLHRHPDELRELEKHTASEYPKSVGRTAEQLLSGRPPEVVEAMRQKLKDFPPNYGDMARSFLSTLSSFGIVRKFISDMKWEVLSLPKNIRPLVTSDMPIIISNGLMKVDGHLALPIGPRRLFLATTTNEFMSYLHTIPNQKIVSNTNDLVIRASKKFVYASDESQMRFIENRVSNRSDFSVMRWLLKI